MTKLIFATRASALARWQTNWVMDALQKIHPDLVCEEKIVITRGDKVLDQPLAEIDGKGWFTRELEGELRAGIVDCAVHSLKDLPVEKPADLTIGCIPVRAEVRDTLISAKGYTLSSLPEAASVGTSSLRRSSQLLSIRPDLRIRSLRGNVDTRVRNALNGVFDAIILAGAGLLRLGLEGHVSEWLPLELMLPAPGQGALAVQCRSSDQTTLGLLAALDDHFSRKAVTSERAFLSGLGGGCTVPIAAHATATEMISLTGLVASPDGKQVIRVTDQGGDAENLGHRLARNAIQQGASEILALGSVR